MFQDMEGAGGGVQRCAGGQGGLGLGRGRNGVKC